MNWIPLYRVGLYYTTGAINTGRLADDKLRHELRVILGQEPPCVVDTSTATLHTRTTL